MAQYDGSIRILTEISTEAAKKSLATLSQTINGSAKEMDKLRSKMDALKGQKFYTDDYKKLQADLAHAEETLESWKEELKKPQNENGINAVNKRIKETESLIDSIKEKMQDLESKGKGFVLGEDTQEYANLERQKQYEEEALRLATQHYQAAEKLNDPYGRLSQALNDLNSKLGGVSRIAQSLKTSFSDDSGFKQMYRTLVELSTITSKVGNAFKSAFETIKNEPRAALSALGHFPSTLGNLLISGLSSAANKVVDILSNTIGRIPDLVVGATSKMGDAIGNVLRIVGYNTANILSGIFSKMINTVLHPFQALKSVASTALNGTANIIKSALTPALENIKTRAAGVAATIINGIAHPFQSMKNVASTAIKGTSKLLSGMASVAKKVGSAISSIVSLLKKAASHMSLFGKSTKSSNNMLQSGFKNLLRYGLGIRSMYALINKFRTAVKEGFGNLAQYSEPVNAALSSLKSSLTQLKNSLATAFAPILTAIAPALTTLINLVSRAATAVGMLIAALTGQKSFVKATAVQEGYADALGGTAKNAKEANKQLSSLDKLNNLTSNDSAGSGGGGGGGAGVGDMFETVDIPSKISDLAKMIKEAWEKADFTEIGTLIGTKLKDALDNIPWDAIQETAAKVGKSLATLINGFVEVEGLGYSIGYSIAQAINTALVGLESFAANLHWDSVGKFIADGINGALINIDWETALSAASLFGTGLATMLNNALTPTVFSNIGYTIGMGLNTALTFANDFLTTFEWHNFGANIANGIKAAIEAIDWGLLGTTAGNAIQAIIDTFVGFVEQKPWEGLGSKIATAINNAIDEINLSEFTSSLSDFVIGLLEELSIAIEETDWSQVARDIVEALKKVDWMGIGSGLFDVGLQLVQGLLEAFGELPVPVQIAAAAIGGFLLVLAGASILTTIASTIGGIVTAIGTLVFVLGGPLTIAITAIIAVGALLIANWGKIKEAAGKLGEWIGEKWDALKTKTSETWSGIKNKISEKWEEVKTNTKEKWETIKSDLSEKWENLKSNASENFESIKKTVSDKWSSVKINTSTKWGEIKTKLSDTWKTLKENAKNSAGNIRDKVVEAWNKLKSSTTSIWNGIKNAIKTPINAIIGFINKMISGIVSGMNTLIRALNQFSIDIPDNPLTGAVSIGISIPEIPNVKIPALATGAVIPPNREFLAVLGDQKHGTNIEAPLSTIEEAVENVLSRNGGTGGVKEITIKIPVEIDGRTFFELMRKFDLERFNRTGQPSWQI